MGKKMSIKDLKGMGKNKLIEYLIFLPLLVVVSIGGLAYLMVDAQARCKLMGKLEKKVEETADINSNGFLDLKEISKVYKNLGLSPTYELKNRGFNLDTSEMQKYLKNKGRFNPETDAYHFKDGLRK
jgi:hypothetical protein